jgi:hypothetical protein
VTRAIALRLSAVLLGGAAAMATGGAGPIAIAEPSGGPVATGARGAPPPRVPVMVVGRARVLGGPRTVAAGATGVVAGGRRCALAAGTALAALVALDRAGGPAFHVRDFGGCSARNPAASESLYVDRIGSERARGADGWVYKVGHRAPNVGAGSPQVRARTGQRVLWFFCHMGSGGCQRTLDLTGPARVAPRASATFTVRGYDDRGRGSTVAGARVDFAGASATTGPDGRASLTAPATAGRRRATATAPGLVVSFPLEVRVG